MTLNIGFIGTGNMAGALLKGFHKKGHQNLFAMSPNALSKQTALPFVQLTDNLNTLCKKSDLLILAVKPQKMKAVCLALPPINPKQFVVSIAAGIPLTRLQTALGANISITRAMPNIASQYGQSMTTLCKNKWVTDPQALEIQQLFESVGKTLWFENDQDLHIATLLAGSGPAILLHLQQALINAGTFEGLTAEESSLLLKQALKGTLSLMEHSSESTEHLIKNITSPGGTTEAAISCLKNNKIETLIKLAIIKGVERSKELEANF